MQQPPVQPFDDAGLKAALRRVVDPAEAAPAGLRERILARGITESDDAVDRPIKLPRHTPLLRRFAAAAIIVIGFGLLGYRIWDMNRPPAYQAPYAISNSLYKAMIEAHEGWAKGGATTSDTVKSLAAAPSLSNVTGRATFVADLTRDGWTFQGGAVRNVGSHQAAQLFFTKNQAAISVFSLPASAAPEARDGMTYDVTVKGHPIAGFTRQGGLYCIVGGSADGSLGGPEVKALLERHQGELAKG
jgi:hypothetical protein